MNNLLDRLWKRHEILTNEAGRSLLYVTRHYVHEGSHHAFNQLKERGLKVAYPQNTFGVADHYVPTRGKAEPSIAAMIEKLEHNCQENDVRYFGQGHKQQGIVHVFGAELGITQPGFLVCCGDSHTATHGACGAFAFGIGASEVAHVLATQTLWQKKPKRMKISVNGRLNPYISAKDMALHIISHIKADGATGYAIEYAGDAVFALSLSGRQTLCNMAIESGARSGMVACDDVTFNAMKGKEFSLPDNELEKICEELRFQHADYDHEVSFLAGDIAPTVSWGTSPEESLPVTSIVPLANEYMGLKGGEKISDLSIDYVFIGSCTNSRIEDLRAAAFLLKGRKAKVKGLVSPGSTQIKAQAESEGLDKIFIDAGLDWVNSGCSMCVGMNGDLGHSGQRIASTSNRNFKGRQGIGVRTHLMSPIMVAASAITGKITDFRELLS